MLKGLSTFSEIQILGIENAAEFANRVYKGQYSPLNVLIFKYKYDELQLSMKVFLVSYVVFSFRFHASDLASHRL